MLPRLLSSISNKASLAFIGLLLLLLTALSSYPQAIDDATRSKLEVIAQYVVSNQDQTDTYLEKLSFVKPQFIDRSTWNAYPPVRKIELAYKCAALNRQGDQFIAAFAKMIGQEYHSIKSEYHLRDVFQSADVPAILFSHPSSLSDFQPITVPQHIKQQIGTVSKYVNEGALGSLQSVMSHYMHLSDNEIYDILSKANNNQVAFEQGLMRSRVPPPHHEKIFNMAEDLQRNYKALASDLQLRDISRQKAPVSFAGKKMTPQDVTASIRHPNGARRGLSVAEHHSAFKASYARFANYEKASYLHRSRSFRAMRAYRGGHGGVIFGDSILYSNSPKLERLRWRPILGSNGNEHERIGFLELSFSDGRSTTYGPVLQEDVYAANLVIRDTAYHYGQGIGMVSIINNSNINFSGSGRRFGITLHPAVSHLRLGWAFVVVDGLGTARKSFDKAVNNSAGRSNLDAFYNENNSTWKITDKPVNFKSAASGVRFNNIALQMWGFRGNADTPRVSKGFEKMLPQICDTVTEFSRVNEFAKVLAIFRWAERAHSKIENIEDYGSFVSRPICLYIDSTEELQFPDIRQDHDAIVAEREYFLQLLAFNKKDTNRIYASKIDSVLKWSSYIFNEREKLWNRRIQDTGSVMRSTDYFEKEDTSGFFILTELYNGYTEKWIENNIQLMNPDSLNYYKKMSRQAIEYLTPLQKLLNAYDSIVLRNQNIVRRYNIKKPSDLIRMPETAQVAFLNNLDRLTALEQRLDDLSRTPRIIAGKAILYRLEAFQRRNRIVSIQQYFAFIEAEHQVIADYYSHD